MLRSSIWSLGSLGLAQVESTEFDTDLTTNPVASGDDPSGCDRRSHGAIASIQTESRLESAAI